MEAKVVSLIVLLLCIFRRAPCPSASFYFPGGALPFKKKNWIGNLWYQLQDGTSVAGPYAFCGALGANLGVTRMRFFSPWPFCVGPAYVTEKIPLTRILWYADVLHTHWGVPPPPGRFVRQICSNEPTTLSGWTAITWPHWHCDVMRAWIIQYSTKYIGRPIPETNPGAQVYRPTNVSLGLSSLTRRYLSWYPTSQIWSRSRSLRVKGQNLKKNVSPFGPNLNLAYQEIVS
jgi:hypothetical protein